MKITEKIEIYNCDCFEFIKTIESKSIDLLLVDTPYGMDFQSNHRKEKHIKIANDNNLQWLPDWIIDIKRILKEDSHACIFCSWHKIDVFKIEIEKIFKIKNIIVWSKNGGGMGDLSGGYGGCHEFIIFINNGKNLNGKRDTDVINKAYRTGNDFHPTEKPVNLMEYLIEKSTKENDLVFDCFMGSGATALACHNTNRRFIGCEIEKIHYDTSVKRIQNQVSQQRLF